MARLLELAQVARGDGGLAWQVSIRDLRRYMDSIEPDRFGRELAEISEPDLLRQIQAAGAKGRRFLILLDRIAEIREGVE